MAQNETKNPVRRTLAGRFAGNPGNPAWTWVIFRRDLRLFAVHINPTRYGAKTLGGILFGIGFGLAAYCPGTGAAALGQGNYDAIAVLAGLMAGSYVFAEASGWLARTVNCWGDRGVLTLDRVLNLKPRVLVPVVATVLALVLAAIHVFVDPTP